MQEFQVKIRGNKEFATFSRKDEAMDNTVIIESMKENYHMELQEGKIKIVFPNGYTYNGNILDMRLQLQGE